MHVWPYPSSSPDAALQQQQFRQQRSVLARDTGDQGYFRVRLDGERLVGAGRGRRHLCFMRCLRGGRFCVGARSSGRGVVPSDGSRMHVFDRGFSSASVGGRRGRVSLRGCGSTCEMNDDRRCESLLVCLCSAGSLHI